MIYIVYPEKRWVTDDQIDSWYSDARADGLLEDDGSFTDPHDQAGALDNIGWITVGSRGEKK